MNDSQTPYAELNPNLILNAVESLGLSCTGNLSALNSYENRVYQIGITGLEPVIVKFYRPHRWTDAAILEEHQFAAEIAAYEIPVIAPLVIDDQTLHHYQGFRFVLFPHRSGRALELDNIEHLEWMGRFIGRLHAVGACRTFKHRIHLDVQAYGYQPYQFLIENNFIPTYLETNFRHIGEKILEQIELKFKSFDSIRTIRLHGDCHPGNVLWNAQGPQIVDLDDCLSGPAIQDIWMLLSGDTEQMKLQLIKILKGYNEFYNFDKRELQLIDALRTLRMMHYSGWLAKRWNDPAFPLNFPWFNTNKYWEEQLQFLNEQSIILADEEDQYNDRDGDYNF